MQLIHVQPSYKAGTLNLYMYCIDSYREALTNKLYVLLDHPKISNNLISYQTQTKMQLKWIKLTHKFKTNHSILILAALPKAHQSVLW